MDSQHGWDTPNGKDTVPTRAVHGSLSWENVRPLDWIQTQGEGKPVSKKWIRIFTEEDTRRANNHMENFISWVIQEMQIKTTMRKGYTPIRTAQIKTNHTKH